MDQRVSRWRSAPLAGLVTAVLLIVFTAPFGAWAQEVVSQEIRAAAQARALHREGVVLVGDGQFVEAVDRFERALALWSSPNTAFNLAATLKELERYVAAREVLQRYVLRVEEANPQVVEAAQRLLQELEASIGTFRLSSQGDDRGVQYQLDGAVLDPAVVGVATPVDPGAHVVRAFRDGEVVGESGFTLEPGGVSDVSLVIAPSELPSVGEVGPASGLSSGDGPAQEQSRRGGQWLARQWWLWTAVGVLVAGGVGLAVGLSVDDEPQPVTGSFTPGLVEIGQR